MESRITESNVTAYSTSNYSGNGANGHENGNGNGKGKGNGAKRESGINRALSAGDRSEKSAPSGLKNISYLVRREKADPDEPVAKPVETLEKLDAYSNIPSPQTALGGLVTVCVWLATLAYTAYAIYVFVKRPATVTSVAEWAVGTGPFPITVQCTAASGCYVSNRVSPDFTEGITTPDGDGCTFVATNDTIKLQVLYSNNPQDGLSLIYDRAGAPAPLPAGFGYNVISEAVCQGDEAEGPMCTRGRKLLSVPGRGGWSTLSLVRTKNYTAKDLGRLRHEWFTVTGGGDSVGWDSGATSCTNFSTSVTWVQAKLRVYPSWIRVTVRQNGQDAWMTLWGTCGGSFGIFLQIGAMLVILTKLTFDVVEKHQERRPRPARPPQLAQL